MHWLTRLMQNLTMVSGGETVCPSFRGRDQTTYLWFRPALLSPLLFSRRAVREWCRLNFSAWYDHCLSHRAHGACHQNQCVFFFPFPWRTIQFLETRRIPTMCGNSSSILREGWKALDTLGRKPLDPCSEVITLGMDNHHLTRLSL